MAHVILGLLLIAPQSQYDLIKSFEAGVALFYSASSGSIKRALNVLAAQGLIEVASVEAGGRGRKVYRVTAPGQTQFLAWMTGELDGAHLETAALPRLFFLGLLDAPDRPAVLERIQRRAQADLAKLETLRARLDTQDVPAQYRDVLTYQLATLDYGIAAGRSAAAWFADFAPPPAHRSPARKT